MKRIAVLGGTGMAGHVAVRFLSEQGYDVYFTSRSAPDAPNSMPIDATDIHMLCAWLDKVQPGVVLNCMGILQKEADERPDRAILINSFLPKYLAYLYSNTQTKIIHLSTDCVFSGKRGGYMEDDLPDGETIYDRTKALGEINNYKDLTFRMSIIGPDCNENGSGLFNWFMQQKGTIRGFTKAIWNGVSTIELSRAVDAAIKQNLTGLYQLVPSEVIDKYSLLQLFCDVFNSSDVEVEPFEYFVADKTLVNTRMDFDFAVRSYSHQIHDMRSWIEMHKEEYLHYEI